MIKKIYRLKEKEVKKVLGRTKPFFSYGLVLNASKNKSGFNRFAIVIGSKSVITNVERNYFRRLFYDIVKNHPLTPSFVRRGDNIDNKQIFYDYVFVVKKKTKLDKKSKESIKSYNNDINFLIKKSKGKKY